MILDPENSCATRMLIGPLTILPDDRLVEML